jgi:DNA-binding winged helix-turn-helix (wHTH) protein
MATAISTRIIRVGANDDALLRALAEHRSPSGGWQVEPLNGFAEAEALVIVDFDDGEAQRDAVASVRSQGFCGRILILGGQDAVLSQNDDVIGRPVRLGALLGRLDTYWAQTEDLAPIRLGPYAFVQEESVLRHSGDEALIRLTELECRLLTYLVEAEDELVSREQLLAGVWGYSAGIDTHTVETHIWRLRQKIETDDPLTHFLVTETGGYRLVSDCVPEND